MLKVNTGKAFIVFFLLFVTGYLHAQDTLSHKPVRRAHIKVVFNLDARNSFVFSEPINIFGAKLGLEWKNKLRIGLGGYFLTSDLTRRITYDKGLPDQQLANYTLRFFYIAAYSEYVFFQNKHWEFSTPLQLGIGSISYKVKLDNGEHLETRNRYPFIIEPTITGHYKILDWVGIGAGVGYRTMFTYNNQTSIEKNFNAPLYIIKIKLFLGTLYKDIKKK